jgi:succinate dehydrogenase hydrophobic anchor subunit
VGLIKIVSFFSLIWIGVLFIFLGMNAFMTLYIPSTSIKFYLGIFLLFAGLFLVVIGISYVVGELTH